MTRTAAKYSNGVPEGVPIAEIRPGSRKHRRLLRGDKYDLIVRPAGGAE
ncbi:hypothetical protein ACOZ38_45110 [Sphaerisporangium viridialbum]